MEVVQSEVVVQEEMGLARAMTAAVSEVVEQPKKKKWSSWARKRSGGHS